MNLTKDDILTFFSKEYGKEECDQTCPFVEECNSILAKTSGRDTLCDVLGVSNGVSSGEDGIRSVMSCVAAMGCREKLT